MLHQRKLCPKCGTPAGIDAAECLQCGHGFRTQFSADPDQTVMTSPVETPRGQFPAPQQQTPYPQPYQQPPSAPQQNVVIYQQAPPPPVYIVPDPPQQVDICATLSLVLGLVSALLMCFFGWIPGIGAVALGVISLVRQQRNRWLSGQGMAIGGIVLGLVVVIWSGWFGYALMQSNQPGQPIPR